MTTSLINHYVIRMLLLELSPGSVLFFMDGSLPSVIRVLSFPCHSLQVTFTGTSMFSGNLLAVYGLNHVGARFNHSVTPDIPKIYIFHHKQMAVVTNTVHRWRQLFISNVISSYRCIESRIPCFRSNRPS